MSIKFEIVRRSKDSQARIGRLITPHGVVETPVFLPVGSKAAIKTLTPEEIKSIGGKMILGNAYHLYLQPGHKVIEKMGGLHRFMNWSGPILTDSGGYQVFSLSKILNVTDDGVKFKSPIDGANHFLSPEDVIDIQDALGADIAMILDECPPYPAEKEDIKRALIRTLEWSGRCKKQRHKLDRRGRKNQALFGIVQGGVFPDLRRYSVEKTAEMAFSGYGIGGLSVGEPKGLMFEALEKTIEHLPSDKPRYLMGVGDPSGIVTAIKMGVDMFDSALPTRIARNGTVFVKEGRINILNAQHADDAKPLDDGCSCYTCQNFSRAYLKHLYQTGETLALRLLTCHNLAFVFKLIEQTKGVL